MWYLFYLKDKLFYWDLLKIISKLYYLESNKKAKISHPFKSSLWGLGLGNWGGWIHEQTETDCYQRGS